MKLLYEIVFILALVQIISVFGQKEDHFDRHHRRKDHHHQDHRPAQGDGDLKIHLAEKGTARNETVVIDVVQNQGGENGPKTKLKVNLRIHVIQGNIHVNGHKIDHSVITAIHLKTTVAREFESGNVKMQEALVYVRVMVVESTNTAGVKMLSVEEEIVQIDEQAVKQVDIKMIVLELSDNVNESKRTITHISVSKSKLHAYNRKKDTHIWACKGKFPKHPFYGDKKDMRKWRKIHLSHKKPPHFEMGKNRGHGNDNDDDDDDDDHDRHHHHHHTGKVLWNKFCSWFFNLPVGTRAVFCISVILFILLLIGSCCICCCKKTKKRQYLVEKKYQLSEVAGEDDDAEASPLPSKKSLDKQPLVA